MEKKTSLVFMYDQLWSHVLTERKSICLNILPLSQDLDQQPSSIAIGHCITLTQEMYELMSASWWRLATWTI